MFFQEEDPTSMIIAGVVIIGFILFLLIMNAVGGGSSGGRRSRDGATKVRPFSFRRRARKKGLSREYARLLLDLVRQHHVQFPYRVLENSPSLDLILKRELSAIDATAVSEEAKEARKLALYRIKQTLEQRAKRFALIGTTKQLRPGQDMRIAGSGLPPFAVRVGAVTKNMLVVTAPRTESGEVPRWPKGTPLKGEFPRGPNDIYSFSTRVLGYGKSRGEPMLSLEHTNQVARIQNRRFRRKTISAPVSFSPVQIIEAGTGKRKIREAVVGTRRLIGTLVDISEGGCCVQTYHPIPRGSLLKLDFDPGSRSLVSVLGKVRQVRSGHGRGTLMHVMFTKVSRKNMNAINSYVYNFQEA